jgi:hypothetical protein
MNTETKDMDIVENEPLENPAVNSALSMAFNTLLSQPSFSGSHKYALEVIYASAVRYYRCEPAVEHFGHFPQSVMNSLLALVRTGRFGTFIKHSALQKYFQNSVL